MSNNERCVIRFRDLLEEAADEHYGILFEDGRVLCFCCGGEIELGDYVITKKNDGFKYLDEILQDTSFLP